MRLSALKVLRYATGGTHEEGESAGRNRRRACGGSRGSCSGQCSRVFDARRGANRAAAGDVHERRRADPAALLPELPSSRLDRADVAADLRRRAAVGAIHEEPRRRSAQMPPWHVDATVGIRKFKDDPSLSDEEIATSSRGSTAARRAAIPATCRRPDSSTIRDRWHIGKPDLIVTMPSRSERRRRRAGLVGRLSRRCRADRGSLHQGRGSQAGVAGRDAHRPPRGREPRRPRRSVRPAAARSSNTPSARTATSIPEGAGKLMKAGSKIRFNMHYHSVGEVITDRSQSRHWCSIRKATCRST